MDCIVGRLEELECQSVLVVVVGPKVDCRGYRLECRSSAGGMTRCVYEVPKVDDSVGRLMQDHHGSILEQNIETSMRPKQQQDDDQSTDGMKRRLGYASS